MEEVATIAVCESADERTAGVSRRHPASAVMAIIRGRSLFETVNSLGLANVLLGGRRDEHNCKAVITLDAYCLEYGSARACCSAEHLNEATNSLDAWIGTRGINYGSAPPLREILINLRPLLFSHRCEEVRFLAS